MCVCVHARDSFFFFLGGGGGEGAEGVVVEGVGFHVLQWHSQVHVDQKAIMHLFYSQGLKLLQNLICISISN